jgi:hypothetical protein
MRLGADGSAEAEPLPDQVQALCEEAINRDLLPLLADNLFRLDFEVCLVNDCFAEVVIDIRPRRKKM